MSDALSTLIAPCASAAARKVIAQTLAAFPAHILTRCAASATTIRPIRRGERYCDASAELRRVNVDVDAWAVPPSGLFVVAERTLYLRDVSPMTIAHEFGHAVDCALGGGAYLSDTDPSIRSAYRDARRFVTPYAATGIDEYFAEGVRAYVGVNSATSPWPSVSRERLRELDPVFHDLLEGIFAPEARCAA